MDDNDITSEKTENYPVVPGSETLKDNLFQDKFHQVSRYVIPELPSMQISGTHISDVNTGGGNLTVGVYVSPNTNKITALIEAGKAMAEGSLEYHDLMEELSSYQKPRPGRTIIGLENKLNNANMNSLVDDAKYLKGEAIKKITRYQLQSHKAALHNYIYGKIYEIFGAQILPLLQQGKTADEVNKFISNLIILPLADEICEADPTITSNTIRGMLYILTGNCHLAWK